MLIIRKIKDFIDYFGVAKKDRFDTYIKDLIREQTDIDVNKIELLVTKKTRIKEYNEFNYFLFKYKRKTYELLDGNLRVVDNKEMTI